MKPGLYYKSVNFLPITIQTGNINRRHDDIFLSFVVGREHLDTNVRTQENLQRTTDFFLTASRLREIPHGDR
jgi:hypothetical protein